MLTDAFFRRYEDVQLFTAFTERERRFTVQCAQLLVDEVHRRDEVSHKDKAADPATKGLAFAHAAIARELGLPYLDAPRFSRTWKAPNGNDITQSFERSIADRTTNYLTAKFHDTYAPDLYMKNRISFIEIAFQQRALQLRTRRAALNVATADNNQAIQLTNALSSGSWQIRELKKIEAAEAAFAAQVDELNGRFRQANMPLAYHNDFIQVSDDALIAVEIEQPFWNIVADSEWANVDLQMKEAFDYRDRGERNAVSSAMNALESVIKTISTNKGWNTGNEKGAANYIDNLVKDRNGVRFIEVWEMEVLKKLFSDIRNAFGHGPASGQPLPTLLPEQTAWAIDTCMVWIKNLVRRA